MAAVSLILCPKPKFAFKDFVISKAKSGARATYWNNYEREDNQHDFSSIEYEIISIATESNLYTDISSSYYMPKVTI